MVSRFRPWDSTLMRLSGSSAMLGGIEAGLHQMRRTRSLETITVTVGDGLEVVDPTVTPELPRHEGLNPRWHQWSDLVGTCQARGLCPSGVTP